MRDGWLCFSTVSSCCAFCISRRACSCRPFRWPSGASAERGSTSRPRCAVAYRPP